MLILTVVIIFISIFLIIKGASQNKENYLVAGNLTLLLSMIVNIAGSYNFSYRGFITSVIGALIVYGLTVIIIALNIRKKDIIIKELEEQELSDKETTDWIYDAERSDLDYSYYSSYHCSCCNKEIVMYDDEKPYKYCPFCGRMYAAKKLEEEHPVKTRMDKFLEIYPNAIVNTVIDGTFVDICPLLVNSLYGKCNLQSEDINDCSLCKISYWNEEIEK